jgi:signal transduction histidine kinase/putative methionine-R-sulfoxide reductase with GAF domain
LLPDRITGCSWPAREEATSQQTTATTPADFSPSQLAEFLRGHRDAIIERWRAAVADRPSSQGLTVDALIDHIPDLLDAIAETGEAHLADNRSRLDTETAERHALERLAEGLDLSQVVIELAVLRDCILQVWDRERAPGAARPEVRFLNRSVDRAIAASIDRYTLARDRTLKALDRISAASLETRRLDDFLQRLLEVMVETTAAVDMGAIFLREGDELVLRAAVGLDGDPHRQPPVRIGEGFAGRVAAEGRPRSASREQLRREALGPLVRARELSCAYGVPLSHEGRVVGAALIGSVSAPEFSDQDRRLLQAMVARATSGIMQHLLQETAEARAAELAAVIDSIPDAVLVGDAGGFHHANAAALSLFGAASVEEVNRRLNGPGQDLEIRGAATGEPIPHAQRPFARALRGETVTEEISLRGGRRAEDLVVRAAAAPVRLGDRVIGAVVVGTDVTGLERAAQERQRLFEQAQQALADRDHVLAVVSHELRNPLNTVTMAAQILKEMVPLPEHGQKSIASIVRAAERMKRMIQDLLDVSVIQMGRLSVDPRPLDPKSVVQDALEAFEPEAAERGQTLTARVEDGLPMIRADRDRLFQAVANIVGNALKATPKGGVEIGARARGPSEVVFSVRDTGPGIPEELQGRLFEPYWRGQNVYKGAGLGLAIARGIVEAHGGRIWLESQPGDGTTFYVTVPTA